MCLTNVTVTNIQETDISGMTRLRIIVKAHRIPMKTFPKEITVTVHVLSSIKLKRIYKKMCPRAILNLNISKGG